MEQITGREANSRRSNKNLDFLNPNAHFRVYRSRPVVCMHTVDITLYFSPLLYLFSVFIS